MNRREFVLSGAGLAAPDPQEPAGFRIGVVDLKSCFDPARYARMKEVAAELAAFRDRYSKEIQRLRKELAGLQEDVAGLSPATEMYVDKVRKAGHAEYDLKVLQEVGRRRSRELAKDLQARVYAEILRATRLAGERQMIDLVVRDGDARLTDDDEPLITREVLHHRNAIDLTPAVLDQLNADWAAAWVCDKCKRKVPAPACPDCGVRRP